MERQEFFEQAMDLLENINPFCFAEMAEFLRKNVTPRRSDVFTVEFVPKKYDGDNSPEGLQRALDNTLTLCVELAFDINPNF